MRNAKIITYSLGHHPEFDRPVYFLKFSYSEELKELVKSAINELRYQFASRTFYPRHQAGNWLNDKCYKCWFVAPEIWEDFKERLEEEGVYFRSQEGEEEESYYHQEQNSKHSKNSVASTPSFNLFINWLNIDSANEVALRGAHKDLALLLHPDKQCNEKLKVMADILMKLVNHHYDQVKIRKAS